MLRQLHVITLTTILAISTGHIHSTSVENDPQEPFGDTVLVSDKQITGLCPTNCDCVYSQISGHMDTAQCDGDVTGDLGPGVRKLSLHNCHSVQLQWSVIGVSLKHLTLTNFTGNSVVSQLGQLVNLISLTISKSRIPGGQLDLPCQSLTTLEHLSLVGLDLVNIPPLALCPNEPLPLNSLNLTTNKLTNLHWDQLKIFPYLKTVDLSHNPHLTDLVPPKSKFSHLSSLDLRGNNELTTLCNSFLHSLPNLKSLDVTHTSLTNLPTELLLMPHLTHLSMGDFQPKCSCELAATVLQSDIDNNHNLSSLKCTLPFSDPVSIMDHRMSSLLDCTPAKIELEDLKDNMTELPGERIVLDCVASGHPAPVLIWLSPRYELIKLRPDAEPGCSPVEEEIVLNENIKDYSQWSGHLTILPNGSLVIDSFGWRDRGTYTCYVDNSFGNDSVSININLDYQYRNIIYYWSLVFGFSTATIFLACTLFGKLLHHLLWNYGCSLCCGCSSSPPPRTKRLTTVVDSIETYRIQQLEKLRESYTQQSQRIRDNYSLQIERVREQYSSQTRGVGESMQSAKDQYLDQINKLRDYSNGQLARTHENYIFQRQRLRKFSAQNYLKIRETGKYTQKTLNRVLENMPALYVDLTSCRQGQPGMPGNWPSDADGMDDDTKSPKLEMIPDESQSVYFTPSGTPLRDTPGGPISPGVRSGGGGKKGHKRMVSNLSNFFPFWWGMGQTGDPGTTMAIIEPNDHNSKDETIQINQDDTMEKNTEMRSDLEKPVVSNNIDLEACHDNHMTNSSSSEHDRN